jgi:hypothetical protein
MRILVADCLKSFSRTLSNSRLYNLRDHFQQIGCRVDCFTLPLDPSPSHLASQVTGVRLLDVSNDCDWLIAFGPLAHVLRHPNKTVVVPAEFGLLSNLTAIEAREVSRQSFEGERERLAEVDGLCLREAASVYCFDAEQAQRLHDNWKIEACIAESSHPGMGIQSPKSDSRKSTGFRSFWNFKSKRSVA